MAFKHSYCPTCGGEIVMGSDGTIWESFCSCEQLRWDEEKRMGDEAYPRNMNEPGPKEEGK